MSHNPKLNDMEPMERERVDNLVADANITSFTAFIEEVTGQYELSEQDRVRLAEIRDELSVIAEKYKVDVNDIVEEGEQDLRDVDSIFSEENISQYGM